MNIVDFLQFLEKKKRKEKKRACVTSVEHIDFFERDTNEYLILQSLQLNLYFDSFGL